GSAAPSWSGGPSISFAGGAGVKSYVDAGNDLTFDQLPTQQITIVSKGWGNSGQKKSIVPKSPGQLKNYRVIFGWDANGALQLLVPGPVSMTAATAPNVIVPGQWLQVAFTWDGTQRGPASAAHLYVNGIEQTKVSTQNGSGTQYQGATNQPFRIGSSSAYMDGSLNGKMAYLAVYKGRMLTGPELTQLDTQLPLLTGSVVTGVLTANGLSTTMQTNVAGATVKLGFTGSANQQATLQFSGNTLGAVSVTITNPDGSALLSSSASTASF